MRKGFIVLLASLGLLAVVGGAHAQQEQYRWRVGAYLGSMLYYGDLNQQLIPETVNPDHPAFGFSVERLLNKTWSGKVLYTQGQWVANDRTNAGFLARSLNAKTAVQDYSLLFTYHLDNNRQLGRRSFLAPYFSFGLGYTSFSVHGDLQDRNGTYYHYWSDYTIRSVAERDPGAGEATLVTQDGEYETDLSALETERSYPTESFNLPVALGLKFRLSSNVNLNLELLIRYAFTDYLDDVSGAYRTEYTDIDQRYAASPTGREASQRGSSPNVNDFYAFPSVSLHYSFARRKTSYRAPKLYAVADRVDRFTPPPSESLTVMDTIATLTLNDNLGSAESYAFADSLRIVPHVVGQDTLLAIVQPLADSLATLPVTDTLSSVTLPGASLNTMAGISDTLLILSDSLAAVVAPDSVAGDTVLQVVRYASDSTEHAQVLDTLTTQLVTSPDTTIVLSDSLALRIQADSVDQPQTINLVRLRALPPVDTLALITPAALSIPNSLPADTTQPATLIPLSGDRAIRVQPDSSGTRLGLVTYQPTPNTTGVPYFGTFDPRPDSVTTRPVASEVTDSIAPYEKKTVLFSTLPDKKEVSKSTTQSTDGSVKSDSAKASTMTTASPLDTSYVATLNARMDTFSGYLNEVSQKNDTSFTSILNEVKQLKAQLNDLQNAPRPVAQAASIEQKLRLLKLQELGTTEVFFSIGSSTVSAVGAERLQQVAVLVRNAPEVTVRLRGFTDSMGDPERNQLLSQRRAEAVRDVLTEAGVAGNRISVAYFGADRTLEKNEASYGRRVEVVVEE